MTYPSPHDAIYSVLMDYYGYDETDTEAMVEFSALADKIEAALEQVEDAQRDGVEGSYGGAEWAADQERTDG